MGNGGRQPQQVHGAFSRRGGSRESHKKNEQREADTKTPVLSETEVAVLLSELRSMNEHQRRKLRESAKTLTRLSGEEEGQEMADIGEIYKFRENFTDELALMQRRSDG